MRIEAGLLGPLRLLVNGRDITPTAARERGLLAVLLVHCGRSLPSSLLIEEIWDAGPPANAEAALQNYVHLLRKRIDGASESGQGRALVRRVADGYRLELETRHLDSHRFQSSVHWARGATVSDQPDRISEQLQSALDLWRGAPLAGISTGPWTSAFKSQMEDLRIEALTLWADGHLARQRYAHVAATLRGLTHEFPRHDRFKVQLATALQGMGQITEARELLRQLPEPAEVTYLAPQSATPAPASPPVGTVTAVPQENGERRLEAIHPEVPLSQAVPERAHDDRPLEPEQGELLGFSVLGPVRVWRGNEELPIGSPQQRALLAALLLRGGHPATAEELIDALWGEDPPEQAKAALRTYASRTRKALGKDAEMLVSESGGYVIRTGRVRSEAVLDLDAATAQVAEAEKAMASGDRSRARECYCAALAQFSGEPLANVPGPFAERQRMRLTEWQLSLLEHRIDLDLQLGNHTEAVGELTALAAAHPLRERLRELLMLALYRSGRQAEALAVFADTRRLLADELGIDPDSSLVALHQRILEADETLHLSGADEEALAEAGPFVHRPAQLPATVADFTGREAQVERLKDGLTRTEDSEMAVRVITGIGGVGKTTLAVHVAHAAAQHFPDGQLYVSLQGGGSTTSAEPAAALSEILRTLGVPETSVPESLQARAGLYRSLLSGRRVLVVLDDARDAEQVRPLLPGTPGCAVLVTSRSRMADLAGAHLVDLDVMSPDEAMSLFTRIVGEERVAAERGAAFSVVSACGFHPLAIRIAASRLASRRTWTVSALANKFADERRRLDELRVGDQAVQTTFELGYERLNAEQARAFRLLGLPDGVDISVPGAAALLDRSEETTESLLESLVDASLLESEAPDRYRLHSLLSPYARACAERDEHPPSRREEALSRLTDFYLSTAAGAHALSRPGQRTTEHLVETSSTGLRFADEHAALEWFSTEAENLLACSVQAARGGKQRHAADLLIVIKDCLESGVHSVQFERATTAVRDAARAANDAVAEARAQLMLTHVHIVAGRFDQAEEEAHRTQLLAQASGDPLADSWSLNDLGVIANFLGRFTDAETYLLRALERFRSDGDRPSEASALANLSHICLGLGHTERAVELARHGLEIYEHLGHRMREANAHYSLGQALVKAERVAEGFDQLQKAAKLFLETRQPLWEGVAHLRLAQAHLANQSPAQAAHHAERALALGGIGGEWMRGKVLTVLGQALTAMGQHDRARVCWEDALAVFEEMGASDAEEIRALLGALSPAQQAI